MGVRVLLLESPNAQHSSLIRDARERADQCQCQEIDYTAFNHYLDIYAFLKNREFEVIVLDLTSIPLDDRASYLCQLHELKPMMPFILIGEREDDMFAVEMIECGVQQFLVIDILSHDNLQRAIRHAAARNLVLQNLNARLRAQEREQEINLLDQLAKSSSEISQKMMGNTPLSKLDTGLFEQMVNQYDSLLDLAIEQQAYRVQYDLANALKGIANQLGRLQAGPRDVVEIHSTALKHKLTIATPERAQAIVEESRLLVLELMGDLVKYYRNMSVGVAVRNRE